MKDMRSILVYIYTFYVFTIKIATQLWTLINDQTFLTLSFSHTGKGGSKKSGTHYQIIILFHNMLVFSILFFLQFFIFL